jgi:hypothetical protein
VPLTDAERARLRTPIGRGEAPARRLAHARVLLEADQGEGGPGWSDAATAGAPAAHPDAVARVRRAYVGGGPDAAPARRAPARVGARRPDGAAEARSVAVACSPPPAGRERWTLRRALGQTGSSPG